MRRFILVILTGSCLLSIAAKRRTEDAAYYWKDNVDAIGRIISLDSSRFLGAGFYVSPQNVVISASHVSKRDTVLFEHIHSLERDTLIVSHRWRQHDLVMYRALSQAVSEIPGFRISELPSAGNSVIYLGLREDGVLYRFNSRISAIGDYILPGDSVPVSAIAIDANVMSGMSGGPVLDTAGHVIGVIVGRLTHTPQGGNDSTAVLAMPIETLRKSLDTATQSGERRKE